MMIVMMMMMIVTTACVLLLLLASLTPVLTDNLSRFYAKAICRLDKLITRTTVGTGYNLALYRIGRHPDLCITF
jgi:hypothetical protein